MYDCLVDHHPSLATQSDAYSATGKSCPKLYGTLIARLGHDSQLTELIQLSADAVQKGYEFSIQDTIANVFDVEFNDVLFFNSKYQNTLIITCEMRRSPPVKLP